MPNLLERINSKILLKITLLVVIEIILIVSSFGVLIYFQSEQSSLGNSINIAGKNRYLTSNVLLQIERYLDGSPSSTDTTMQLKAAMDSLQSNINSLKHGGIISGVALKPLPSNLLGLWNIVDERWNIFKTSIIQKILIPYQQQQQGKTVAIPPAPSSSFSSPSTTTKTNTTTAIADQLSLTRKGFESMASDLIASSDKLVTQLGLQTDRNSHNLMLLQIIFAILIIGILVLILYLVARMLRPVFALTQAISKVKKGNLDVLVKQKGNDELSVLSDSFNSMIISIRDYIKRQNELTKQIEAANEQLKYKDRLKDEFINIAAHELRTPIQPILGLSQIVCSRIKDGEEAQLLEVISRNAKRLKRLTEDILDVTKIESQSLNLKKEKFNLNDVILNAMDDIMTNKESLKIKKNLVKLQYHHYPHQQDIFVQADRGRISQVIHNLLDNALKFTNAGTIVINSTQIKKEQDKKDDEEEVIVSVMDTGRGLDPEIRPRLFLKFATKSDTGTGLGLFISKSIVEAHGGRIWAENNRDEKGSTFYFSLPLNR